MPNPSWSEIHLRLEEVHGSSGTVSLEPLEGSGIGPRQLQVRSDSGNYLLTFGFETDDDWIVRTFTNKSPKREQVNILGDLWDPQSICTDFGVVQHAFRQFFDTGDISKEMLS